MSAQVNAWSGIPVVDRQFFEQELVRILDKLYGTARRLTRNSADAEDLVSETVIKALEKLDTLTDPACFKGWIFRILSNTFISGKRKAAIRQTLVYDESESDEDENPFWIFDRLHQPFLLWFSNPEIDFVNNLLKDDLERALDDLQEAFRVVVILADVEGFKYTEISEMLDVPVGTIRSRLARGRSQLQKALWQHAKDAGLEKGDVQPAGAIDNE